MPPSAKAVGTIEICLRGQRRLLVRRGFGREVACGELVELLTQLIHALEVIA